MSPGYGHSLAAKHPGCHGYPAREGTLHTLSIQHGRALRWLRRSLVEQRSLRGEPQWLGLAWLAHCVPNRRERQLQLSHEMDTLEREEARERAALQFRS